MTFEIFQSKTNLPQHRVLPYWFLDPLNNFSKTRNPLHHQLHSPVQLQLRLNIHGASGKIHDLKQPLMSHNLHITLIRGKKLDKITTPQSFVDTKHEAQLYPVYKLNLGEETARFI